MNKTLAFLPLVILVLLAMALIYWPAPPQPVTRKGSGFGFSIWVWRAPAYADMHWRIERRVPPKTPFRLLKVMAVTQYAPDDWVQRIYGPLFEGRGTKDNPLTMKDLRPLMNEMRNLQVNDGQ